MAAKDGATLVTEGMVVKNYVDVPFLSKVGTCQCLVHTSDNPGVHIPTYRYLIANLFLGTSKTLYENFFKSSCVALGSLARDCVSSCRSPCHAKKCRMLLLRHPRKDSRSTIQRLVRFLYALHLAWKLRMWNGFQS